MLEFPSRHGKARLTVIDNAHPQLRTKVEHRVDLPELCPYSHNPAPGSQLWIRYQATAHLLELFALDKYILGFHEHQVVRDMEYFVQEVALDCANALGVEVEVSADIEFSGVQQGQRVTVIASGTKA